ncbi:MAG: hypothetical protein IT361_07400 [Gemmatimonadaceae bacterium]|nr:hypothetical protein [Gemmatimonadaceae bacterium]
MFRARGLSLVLLTAVACGEPATFVPASFLIVAGDSTFWVESAASGVVTRRSPMMLANVDGRFHELYVVDEDLSYRDALMVGQRVFRRDILSGDSALVRYDTTIAGIAMTWAARNPDDRPLDPDEEVSDDPVVQATTDTELLDVTGPFLSYEFHLDVDIHGERDQHLTQRGVVDVRDGSPVGLERLTSEAAAARTRDEGRARFSAALDSVRRATDARAGRARQAIDGFAFDAASFELLVTGDGPAIAFLVPGRGARAGGFSLPLGEIPIDRGPWWSDVAPTLPTSASPSTVTWSDTAYDVVATVDSAGTSASLELHRDGRSQLVASLPLPVLRLFRLGTAPRDVPMRRALSRAFDEAAAYGGLTNPTSGPARRPWRRLASQRVRRTWNPVLPATAKPRLPT